VLLLLACEVVEEKSVVEADQTEVFEDGAAEVLETRRFRWAVVLC